MTNVEYINNLRLRALQIDEQLEEDAVEGGYEDIDELLDSGRLDAEGIASVHRDIAIRDTLNMIADELIEREVI